MKKLSFQYWYQRLLKADPWYIAGIALLLILAALRLWHISQPAEVVFDEVYFPLDAQKYLAGQGYFDIHPPLAKWLIALAEWLFGYHTAAPYEQVGVTAQTLLCPVTNPCVYTFSWRIVPFLSGVGLLTIMWLLVKRVTKSWQAAFITLVVLGFDGLLFIYSRLGLMDGILYFFVFTSFYAFVVALDQKKKLKQALFILLSGIFAGCAIGVKWLGLASIILAGIWFLCKSWQQYRGTGKEKNISRWTWLSVLGALVLAALTYVVTFIGEGANWAQLSKDIYVPFHNFWDGFREWHNQSFLFNKNLKDTHPYGSTWWTWPLMIRPIWYYYQQDAAGMIKGILTMGTPLIWWSAFASFLFTLFFIWPKDLWQKCLLYSSILMYIPWVFINRVSFLYYFMGVATVWQLLLAYNLWLLAQKPGWRWVVIVILIAFVLCFFAFYPLFTAMPVSRNYFDSILWFVKWRS